MRLNRIYILDNSNPYDNRKIMEVKTDRHKQMTSWLKNHLGTDAYSLEPASEDASFRSYYRLSYDGISRIIMDAPPAQENVVPFININEILLSAELHTPYLYQKNIAEGFLMLEDLGTRDYLSQLNQSSGSSLYHDAIDALIKLQQIETDQLPLYNADLLSQELTLFPEWLIGKHLSINLSNEHQDILEETRVSLISNALEQPQTMVHRDYHSRNLMVTAENNPGIIDFQDAVIGPVTYDLVSLLKDCYIKWPEAEVYDWVDYYRSIQPLVSDIRRETFIKWFDLMGIQRHLKAIGIFARLNHRDNKPGYLKDIPRTLSYIVDCAPRYEETQALMHLIDELDLVNRVQQ